MEWKEITLGEIAIFKTGKLNSNAAISNGEYPFFTCSPETLRINNYAFDQEAILLAGNNADGNFSIKYYKGKFNAYQRTYVITPIRGKVDIKFLYYALSLCLKQFKNMSQGTSTKFLTVTILNSFSVQLPSISDQHRIASILSSLDRKIELNNKINADLEEMAQAIFKNWFVDFEPFKDGKFVDSELGMIPEGWKVGRLTEIASYMNGLAMQKFPPENNEDSLPVLKIKELGQGFCGTDSDRCSCNIKDECKIHNGDVIFSWSGTLLVDVWCGGDCGLNQHLFKVTSKDYPKWFYYYWTKHHLQEFVHIAKDKAVTMGHIKRGHLEEAMVAIPDNDSMEKAHELFEPILSKMISLRLESSRLSLLRDTLLPRLMSGELEVPE
ncbi:restriction endonuclease subunit S [Segatella copri]|uniref:restriction endonuclease subunit S n=1 Tax=Segatella copri TaxID=165179 RepID=UPI002FF177B1